MQLVPWGEAIRSGQTRSQSAWTRRGALSALDQTLDTVAHSSPDPQLSVTVGRLRAACQATRSMPAQRLVLLRAALERLELQATRGLGLQVSLATLAVEDFHGRGPEVARCLVDALAETARGTHREDYQRFCCELARRTPEPLRTLHWAESGGDVTDTSTWARAARSHIENQLHEKNPHAARALADFALAEIKQKAGQESDGRVNRLLVQHQALTDRHGDRLELACGLLHAIGSGLGAGSAARALMLGEGPAYADMADRPDPPGSLARACQDISWGLESSSWFFDTLRSRNFSLLLKEAAGALPGSPPENARLLMDGMLALEGNLAGCKLPESAAFWRSLLRRVPDPDVHRAAVNGLLQRHAGDPAVERFRAVLEEPGPCQDQLVDMVLGKWSGDASMAGLETLGAASTASQIAESGDRLQIGAVSVRKRSFSSF